MVNRQTLPPKEEEENSSSQVDDDEGEEKKEVGEEEQKEEEGASLAKTPEIDGEFVPKGEEEEGNDDSSSDHLESLKSNHEEMSAHPDIGKLVGAIPKEEGDEGEEEANHLSAPPKPESNAPPKKYTEPALTKVPTKNIGKPKDKVLYPPPVDVEEGENEEKVEEAGAAADEEKKEEKTDDEELPEDDAKKMMLDVSNASSSEGFDFTAGLVATEENADNVSSDAELSAIEKEEDVKEKELESEDETQKERKEEYDESAVVLNEDNSSETSPKEEDEEKEKEEETSSSEAEAEPIPAKKMKLPTVSDSEIDAFVKDGTLPAEEEKKEEKVNAPVEPENDDVLDLKRAGMGDELGFDFAEGLKPATTTTTTMETTMETEEAEVATAEPTEETEETMPAEKQKEEETAQEQEGKEEKPSEGENEDEN
jgi:hypothetical protein